MSSDHDHPIRTHCQNCETELKGRYCVACGQKDFDFHQSFGHVVHEALETWFHVDGSFFRGFFDLLFRPGAMTKEFNEGKRARHVPPLRFYLVVSVVFFFIIPPHDLERGSTFVQDAPTTTDGQTVITGNVAGPAKFRIDEPDIKLPFVSEVTEREIGREIQTKFEQPEQIVLAFLKALPKTLLICLPLFALFTRLLYWRSGWVYLQHLVMSVHLHTFVFLWWMAAYGWTELIGLWSETLAGWFGFFATLYLFYGFYATLRRAFGGSRKRTFVKGTLLGTAYVFALSLAMGATFVITLLV